MASRVVSVRRATEREQRAALSPKPQHPFDGDTYWVLAETAGEVRRLVARNVPEATAAQTEQRFACVLDNLKTPPRVRGTSYATPWRSLASSDS